MQGVFSAGSIPAALGILGAAYPPRRQKNRVFATFSTGNLTGWVVGLVIGGILISYSSWRWAFRLMAILGFIFTVLAFIVIPQDLPQDPLQKKEKVDWLGAVTNPA
jgi:MFS family permease